MSEAGLSVVELYSGRPADALPLIDEAAAAGERALAVRPDNPTYRRFCRKVAETRAEVSLQTGDGRAAAEAAQALLDERYAPAQPVLAAGLLARSAHAIVAAEGDGAAGSRSLVEQARSILRGAIDAGRTLAELRQDFALSGQWDKPGFAELVAEFERTGK